MPEYINEWRGVSLPFEIIPINLYGKKDGNGNPQQTSQEQLFQVRVTAEGGHSV